MSRRLLAVLPPAVLVIAALVPASAVAARPADPQLYYWKWSDDSRARARTFHEADYPDPARLPRLVVTAIPAAPSRTVRLEYRDDSGWQVDDSARLSADGTAALTVNPFCPDGRWCRGTFDYRAAVGGRTAALRITFAP